MGYLISKYFFILTLFSAASIVHNSDINWNSSRHRQRERLLLNETFLREYYGNSLIPQVHENCKHGTICEIVMNYPEKFAEEQIKKLIQAQIDPGGTSILGQEVCYKCCTSCDLCTQIKKIIIPLAARMNTESNWFFILNSRKSKFYSYSSYKCRDPAKSCSANDLELNNEYEGLCEQQYTEVYMYGFDNKEDTPKRRLIPVESWCSCIVHPR